MYMKAMTKKMAPLKHIQAKETDRLNNIREQRDIEERDLLQNMKEYQEQEEKQREKVKKLK